jgi:nucleotide-binding universal stress UspA family protein
MKENPMLPQPIVVGIDGSESAVHAAGWAAAEAVRRELPLRLVHTFDIPLGYAPGVVAPQAVRDGMCQQGWAWLHEARDAVAGIAQDLEPELIVKQGPVLPFLVEQSQTATMIVLGTRGLGGFTGLLIGSISVALAGRAHCPVVVTRGTDNTSGDIVVGIDGTPAGEAALAFAFEEASLRDRAVVAVHTWTDSVLEAALAGSAAAVDFYPLQQQAYELLAERLAGWQEKYPDVIVRREVVRDRPATALLRYSEGAALVVVGSRGRGGFRGLILGSTSQHLLHHASCPVAVVRTDPDKEDQP